ncbi:hypothetical protein QQF64_021824 [Cirrhinus molitorella]|uniref:Secreted protein n=1 Tax=Cirrhinus molitorella TaxID=172907 RepID=A0ABR3L8R4_9TELE
MVEGPVFSACHLLLSCLFVWLFALTLNCCMLFIYECQALLDVHYSVVDASTNCYLTEVGCFGDQTHESLIPDCIRRWPFNFSQRKRRRKRCNRAGRIVKLKALLRAGFPPDPSQVSLHGGSFTRRPLIPANRWLRPVLARYLSPVSRFGPHHIGLGYRQQGANHGNLECWKERFRQLFLSLHRRYH